MKRKILFGIIGIITIGVIYIFTYVPKLSEQHGILDTKLYLGEGLEQPLFVAFGGGGGGNDWSRDYLRGKRDSLIQKGYAVLAIGYFNSKNAPKYLDRISLNAIADTILNTANHPQINASKIVLFGGSRGGELVLNLGSRYPKFTAVIALSTSHVSFPAITWSANTSSWMHDNNEVTYVPAPLKMIGSALKGDLFTAHSIMLENKVAVTNAEIEVENINGPLLIVSGKQDEQWPATRMSNRIIERLKEKEFEHYHDHIILDGGHIAPLNRFDLVFEFLERQVSSQ